MSAGGKGDAPRPFSVSRQNFQARWDRIFSRNCDRCGKPLGDDDHIHTCSPQVQHLPADDTEGGQA